MKALKKNLLLIVNPLLLVSMILQFYAGFAHKHELHEINAFVLMGLAAFHFTLNFKQMMSMLKSKA